MEDTQARAFLHKNLPEILEQHYSASARETYTFFNGGSAHECMRWLKEHPDSVLVWSKPITCPDCPH